jgi:hypothetical protein
MTTLKEGLKNGGGISESLSSAIYDFNATDNNTYWGRWWFDLLFFILINMLFI